MANIVPDSFKTDLLGGVFDFDSGGSTFKLALYTSLAGFSTASSFYICSNFVFSSVSYFLSCLYTLTNNCLAISSNIAYVDFADLTFSSVTLTANSALIYKDTTNEAVLVLDFGGDKTATNGHFVIQFPAADSTNAIIRLGDA